MNPFNFGNPAPPHQMVGSWDQVKAIAHDLINPGGHSHIVIGVRRFGKSSFLESLEHFLLKQMEPEEPGAWYVIPILVNLHSLSRDSEEGVFGLIVKTLYNHFDPLHANKAFGAHFNLTLEKTLLYSFIQSKQRGCDLDEFSEILVEFLDLFSNSYGFLRLIFLLDEIEVALERDWTEIFFSQLRSLIYQGPLANHIRCVIAGSSRVIDVREQGSPLLNMLNITYLKALEDKDILQIINWASGIRPNVAKAVLEQCGGHPFVAQYLMYHIWEAGTSKATVSSVAGMASKFIHEREADLEQWRIDISEAGQVVYKILSESTNWLTETQVRQRINTPDIRIGRGLSTLCYHGLAVHDGTWSKYRSVGKLFKGWFQKNVLPSLEVSKLSITSMQDISFQGHSTFSKKANYGARGSIVTYKSPRSRAFISYSHKDEMYLRELQTHLAPYIQSELVDIWDDTKILPGSKWREEIEKALNSTKVAVLLISADFLASDFIRNIELPSLLAAREQEGAIILTVLLRPCAFTNTDIGQFQAVNTPSTPLSKMNPGRRDEVWSRVAELVREALRKK